jgi:predicted nucleic acid-binding protein
MILLDTNIVSETIRPKPNRTVVAWLDDQPEASLYICTPVLAELRYGQELLPASARKDQLRATIDRFENEVFQGRILDFNAGAAWQYGRIAAAQKRAGRRIEGMDVFIAAIALAHDAIVATRNIDHFDNMGIELINPFEAIV